MKSIPKKAFWRQFSALLPVYMNLFMLGCTMGWVPNAIYFSNKGELTASVAETSRFISCCELARLLMSIPAGLLVDKFGRKNIIIGAVILHFISWSVLSVNSSVSTIYIIRFMLGTSVALVESTTAITIGEIASPEIRAKLTAISQQFLICGMIFETIISLLFSSYFMLSYCTLALCVLNFVLLYWVSETPNYLISISQNEKAFKHLKYLRHGYPDNETIFEFDNAKKYIENEKKRKSESNWLKFVASKESRTPLMISFTVNFLAMAIGIDILMNYVPIIIPANEFLATEHLIFLVQISSSVTTFILPFYIEKFPRRVLLILGAISLSLCFLVLSLTYFYYSEYNIEIFKFIFTFGYLVSRILISGTVMPMIRVLNGEILPQSLKGFGGSLCVVAQSVANIVVVQVFHIILDNFQMCYNFIVYSANCLILVFVVYYLLPESRGKFLSDIQMEISKKVEKSTN